MKAEAVMRRPMRDVLIEGKSTGELNVPDVELIIDALHGAVGQVALIRLTRDGTFDAEEVADQLIPLIATGLAAE